MEVKMQTSFIPKKPITENRGSGSTMSLFLLISIILLIVSIALAGGVWLWQKALVSQIAKNKDSLVAAKNSYEKDTINSLIRLSDRIEVSKNLLAEHLAVSPVFALLEKNVLRNIRLKSLKFSYGGDDTSPTGSSGRKIKIDLTGTASSYGALSKQSDAFGSENLRKFISSPIISGFIDPNYRGENLSNDRRSVLNLQKENVDYEKALNNTTAIREKRNALTAEKGRIDLDSLSRLEKLLPDNVDNIKLVIDMNQIAQNHALVLKNIKLDTDTKSDSDKLGVDNNKYGTVGLSFSVNSSYDNFQNFLTDLERSLRLVEITELSVMGNDTGIYDFSVGLKTY